MWKVVSVAYPDNFYFLYGCKNHIKMFFPGIDCNQLPEVVLSPPVYCTHWVEKVFVGDHGDAPKVRKGKKRPLSARSYITFIREGIPKISTFCGIPSLTSYVSYPWIEPHFQDCYTIQLAVKTGLAEVRENRKVRQVRVISDTGGENWGTKVWWGTLCLTVIIRSVWSFPSMWSPKKTVLQALAQYANWPALHECEVVWCPTAANHSGKIIIKLLFLKKKITFTLDNLKCLLKGQPSDGAGGEFKRRIMSLALAGECKFIEQSLRSSCPKNASVRGINSAEDLVTYLKRESIGFSEVKQTRFLRATTTKR